MPVGANRVGDRHRRDMGDIEAPARSMADLGLLQPIVIRSDDQLIAGHRRLARHPFARDDCHCGKPGWEQSSERRRPALTRCWAGRNCYGE
jgi:ParB/Sulfiredoxin domain